MRPNLRHELIPRDEALRLIGTLDGMKSKLLDAAQQWQLLDDTGHVPAAPVYADLIQVEEILDPVDGALERLSDFFEAAGEKAKDSDADDGFGLAQDFEEAAVDIRRLNEDLHLAVDRMRALTTPPPEPSVRVTHSPAGARPTPTPPTNVSGRRR